jgi:hypothetical protein
MAFRGAFLVVSGATAFVAAGLTGAQTAPVGRPAVNQDSLVFKDFDDRVAAYEKLLKRTEAEAPLPKQTGSASKIQSHRAEIRPKVRAARGTQAQGEIFTPEIGCVFRKLLAGTLSGPEGERIRASLHDTEAVNVVLKVNQPYPENVPVPTTPPSLLLNLPKLPKELEYRIVGRTLVLRDIASNLVVDFLPDALPSP